MAQSEGIEVHQPSKERYGHILTPDALDFVATLQREFGPTRQALLARRADRQAEFSAGALPDFLPETADVRGSDWTVGPIPADLTDRRVEITGPTERKMLINALNSGAKVFMADFEDANAPTWDNMFGGQANLIDAIERTISFESPEGRQYRLNDEVAVLMPRPRGWHLPEKHIVIDGQPAS
jgi:malate synthase